MAGANAIAVLAPIKAGQEDDCREMLEDINSDKEGCVEIRFARENRTHFARFVIISHPDGGERRRLLFAAIFDGSRRDFFEDMAKHTYPDIGAIWDFCEGYGGDFVEYALEHDVHNGTFLRGHRFDTVPEIQKYLEVRDKLRQDFSVPPSQFPQVLSKMKKRPAWFAKSMNAIHRAGDLWRDVWVTLRVVPQLVGLLRYGTHLVTVYKKMKRDIWLELEADRDYSYATYDKSGPCHPLEEGDEVIETKEEVDLERLIDRQMVQNQMTIITANNPKVLRQQYAVLNTLGVLAQIPFLNRKSFIPTIHFGRWMMIDDGKRMLFLSNYDGSWENYIGDFVDKASAGLDAFWGGSLGWRIAATLDIELFKEGIRCHQTRASFFYSAYPKATVVNIRRARALARAYENNINEETAKQWLKDL